MTAPEVFARVIVAYVVCTPLIGQWLWSRARARGWRQGIADKDEMIATVYGPSWKERLILHDNVCDLPDHGTEDE